MLNYTTTTIVNDIHNVVIADGSDVQNAANLGTSLGTTLEHFFSVKFGPKLKTDSSQAILVGKQAYTPAVLASATINIPTYVAPTAGNPGNGGIYRIALYIRLRNNNNPYFYNNWTFKGRPLYIEYSITANAATCDTPQTIAARAKKLMLAQYGYDLVKFTANGANLVITAADQWEIFMDQDARAVVDIQKLEIVDTAGNVVSNASTTLPTHEEFVTVSTVNALNGNEAFGDFAHIVKDLRLPTDANLRWQGIAQGDVFGGEPNDDKPMPNGKYTQYTIQYTADRGVLQQTALGGVATSRTVHVFYVESGAVTDFEQALAAAGISTTVVTGNVI